MKAKELAEILLTKPESDVCIKREYVINLTEILIIVRKVLNQSVLKMGHSFYLKSKVYEHKQLFTDRKWIRHI